MTRIKAVIWDIIGVYFTEGRSAATQAIAEAIGSETKPVRETLMTGTLSRFLKTGRINFDKYLTLASQLLNENSDLSCDLSSLDMEDLWFSKYEPREGIEDLLDEIKSKKGRVNIALSNNFPELVDYLDQKYEFLSHFDKAVWSYEYGALKPAISIFREAASRASCGGGYQCVYIDDLDSNISTAKRLEMLTIKINSRDDDKKVTSTIRQGLYKTGVFKKQD